jgi:hypothetical protein
VVSLRAENGIELSEGPHRGANDEPSPGIAVLRVCELVADQCDTLLGIEAREQREPHLEHAPATETACAP